MNTQTHVNSHKQTMAVPNFEVWKNAFVKLLPQHAIKNPVMAIVWLGTVVTAMSTVLGYTTLLFGFAVTAILFITILFANYAEAVAEARGRGQASSLRAARENLTARRLNSLTDRQTTQIAATELHLNDFIEVHAGELVPADGEIVEGFATINESAVTGESAPVLREAGTDRSGVIGGTKVLTDRIVVQVTAESGQSFLDRMIALVEGSNRQKTPNEIALGFLLMVMTITFLIVVISLPFIAKYLHIELDPVVLVALLVCLIPTTIGGLLPAIGIAGMNRALKANVLAKSGKAVEVAGDIDVLLLDKTGTITYGDRQATSFYPLTSVTESELRAAAWVSSLADPTPEGKSIVKLAKEQGLKQQEPEQAEFISFSASTRISGVNLPNGDQIRKGALDAILKFVDEDYSQDLELKARVEQVAKKGATPLVVANQHHVLGVIELSDVIKHGIKEHLLV